MCIKLALSPSLKIETFDTICVLLHNWSSKEDERKNSGSSVSGLWGLLSKIQRKFLILRNIPIEIVSIFKGQR